MNEASTYQTSVNVDYVKKITRASYTAEEIIDNFHALFESLDFKAGLSEMGISGFRLLRRRRALSELKALAIVFWRVALERSFPQDAEGFFELFLETSPILNISKKKGNFLRTRIKTYLELLQEEKDQNFIPIAVYLAGILSLNSKDMKRCSLKLSLLMRSMYNLIFDKLV